QLVAGPIERAKKLMPQLLQRQPFTFENLEQGIRLILWGLLKKIVVADRLIHAAYPAFLDPGSFTTGELVFSASGMLVALYLDFSAYSEIARGVARLFGIRLSINFNFPHTATNAADYWRRWHMTMSSWVHDYLFVPLGGFHPRHFWRHTRITLITMGLVGLWHGAAWNFIFWGLGHGLYLIIYQIIRLKILRKYRKHVFFMSLPWRFGSWCFNIATRVLIGVCFFAPDFSRLKIFLYRILIQPDLAGFNKPSILLGLGIIISFWIFHYLRSKSDMQKHIDTWNPMLRGAGYAFLIYLILFGAVDTAEQFIYYQF
ncbi:MAG: hypothetical protein KKE17_05440, partial [Proteobacteria bacterium]|nr:hypothetical protein [Pseudomonadota bacterium]